MPCYSTSYRSQALESRRASSTYLLDKYPLRVPAIVVPYCSVHNRGLLGPLGQSSKLPDVPNPRTLFPRDIQVMSVIKSIRKNITIDPYQSIFLFAEKGKMGDKGFQHTLLGLTDTMDAVYTDHKDTDGFLYLVYSTEDVFGSAVVDFTVGSERCSCL